MKAAGRTKSLAEPDNARKGIDDAKPITCRSGNQQSAVVRAEVKRGVGVVSTQLFAMPQLRRGRISTIT
jgi:hypothetical protein